MFNFLQNCEILQSIGIDSIHVNSLPKGDETPDMEISSFANEHKLIVVTKDSDFYHSHMIFQNPEKLLSITTGNIKNRELFDLIRINITTIKTLFETCNYVELTNESIIGHE